MKSIVAEEIRSAVCRATAQGRIRRVVTREYKRGLTNVADF